MRADTHDGPEQMLHVRGLIHCCSSHVRRSWNSVLQRTAGPYIMAPNRPAGMSGLWSLLGAKRTWLGHGGIDAFDPERTSAAAARPIRSRPRRGQVLANLRQQLTRAIGLGNVAVAACGTGL